MRSVAAAVVLLFGCVVACGSSTSNGGGSSTSSSSGGSSSGGSSSGGTGAAEPFTPKGVEKQGAVTVWIRTEAPGATPKLNVAAYFLDYSGSNGVVPDGYSRGNARATDCTKRSKGGCETVKCTLTPDDSFAFAPPRYVSAGDLTITRSSGAPALKVSPDSQLTYGASEDTAPFESGETVTVVAGGADVPSFSETMPFLDVVAPAASEVRATDSDVEVRWTNGGGVETVIVTGETGSVEAGFVATLTCRFDGAANTGTIPIAILEDLRGNELSLLVSADVTTKQLGGFEMRFHGETSTGEPPGNLTLIVSQ